MQISQELIPDMGATPVVQKGVPDAAVIATVDVPLTATILSADTIARRIEGQDVHVVSALSVALHAVQLPLRGNARRLAALPYALEEELARPVDEVHHAICGASTQGRVLAASVARDVMEAARAQAAGKPIVPEQFILPVPTGESLCWNVWSSGTHALVRQSDGTGFGVRTEMLAHLWRVAGRPPVDAYGVGLPPEIAATNHDEADLPPPGPLPDLRQGDFATNQKTGAPLIALAACVTLAIAGHIGLAYADLQRQRATADALRAEASALLARNIPTAHVTDDPRLLYRRLEAASGEAPGFLSIFGMVAQTLGDAPVQFANLNWSGRDETLTLQIEAPGIEALQAAESSLRAAQLDLTSGAVTAGGGSARMTLTVKATP